MRLENSPAANITMHIVSNPFTFEDRDLKGGEYQRIPLALFWMLKASKEIIPLYISTQEEVWKLSRGCVLNFRIMIGQQPHLCIHALCYGWCGG